LTEQSIEKQIEERKRWGDTTGIYKISHSGYFVSFVGSKDWFC